MTAFNDYFVVYIAYVCLNYYVLMHYSLSFTLNYEQLLRLF